MAVISGSRPDQSHEPEIPSCSPMWWQDSMDLNHLLRKKLDKKQSRRDSTHGFNMECSRHELCLNLLCHNDSCKELGLLLPFSMHPLNPTFNFMIVYFPWIVTSFFFFCK